jgi:hypothetical protein
MDILKRVVLAIALSACSEGAIAQEATPQGAVVGQPVGRG